MSVLDDLDAPLQSALRSAERATDAYIRTLVDSAWRDLTPHFQESRLYLKFLPRTHPQAGSTFARPDGQISVGAKDLSELHQSTLVISEYLAKNFSVVNSAGLGENLPPSKLVALEEFPTAAIAWSPALVHVDGYIPSARDIMKIAASRIERGERLTRMLDAVRFDPESLDILARGRNDELFLDHEAGPFLRRLHNHQLRSGILFLLAHEASHVLLKHRAPGVGQHRESRRLESEADDSALRLVAQVEGFDLRAAIGLFRSVHEAQGQHIALGDLSHPQSAARLAVLCSTLAKREDYSSAYGADIEAVLSTLRESLGCISLAWKSRMPELPPAQKSCPYRESGRTERADIVTWSDFKFAYVVVSTDEDWSYYQKRRETKEFWEIPYEIFKLDLLDFDPNDGGSSEARSSVFVSPDRVEAAEVRRKGDRLHRIYRVRIPRPPAWSTIRPQGLMRVVGLTAVSSVAVTPELRAKLKGLRVRSFVWDTNEHLLGDQDLLAMARCVSPRQAIAWAISCKMIGFTEIAEGLALTAVAREPVEVGFEHTSSVLIHLLNHKSWTEASKIAEIFASRVPEYRSVIRLAIAFGAFSSGDLYRAYDESALEALLGFYDSYLEEVGRAVLVDVDEIEARPLSLALRLMLSIEAVEPELAVVGDVRRSIERVESVGVFRGMYLLWRMSRKLRRLSVATRSLLSVRFLEAEILALRSKIGSRRSLTKAREAFSALTNDAPWLATAFAWLYYIEKNLGDNDAAETALKRAEDLAPSNKFVQEASGRAQEIGRSERFGSAGEYDRAAQEARQSHVPPDRWVLYAGRPKDVVFEEELAVPENLCVD